MVKTLLDETQMVIRLNDCIANKLTSNIDMKYKRTNRTQRIKLFLIVILTAMSIVGTLWTIGAVTSIPQVQKYLRITQNYIIPMILSDNKKVEKVEKTWWRYMADLKGSTSGDLRQLKVVAADVIDISNEYRAISFIFNKLAEVDSVSFKIMVAYFSNKMIPNVKNIVDTYLFVNNTLDYFVYIIDANIDYYSPVIYVPPQLVDQVIQLQLNYNENSKKKSSIREDNELHYASNAIPSASSKLSELPNSFFKEDLIVNVNLINKIEQYNEKVKSESNDETKKKNKSSRKTTTKLPRCSKGTRRNKETGKCMKKNTY